MGQDVAGFSLLLIYPQAPHCLLHNPTTMEETPEEFFTFHLTWGSAITAHDSIFAVAAERGERGDWD